jgi:hypothetical protein
VLGPVGSDARRPDVHVAVVLVLVIDERHNARDQHTDLFVTDGDDVT